MSKNLASIPPPDKAIKYLNRHCGRELYHLIELADRTINWLGERVKSPPTIDRYIKGISLPRNDALETFEAIVKWLGFKRDEGENALRRLLVAYNKDLDEYKQRVYNAKESKVSSTNLPPDDVLMVLLQTLADEINDYSFPAAIADTEMLFRGFNRAALAILPYKFIQEILKKRMNGFKLLYRMKQDGILDNYHEVMSNTIKRFKLVNVGRQNEEYYQKYPHNMQLVLMDGYADFEKAWYSHEMDTFENSIHVLTSLSTNSDDYHPFNVFLTDKDRTYCEMEIKTQPARGLDEYFVMVTYEPTAQYNTEYMRHLIHQLSINKEAQHLLSWMPPYQLVR